MEIKMKVKQGPQAGVEYSYSSHERGDVGTIILVGRDYEAQWRLSEDRYVSRKHFTLEIRPPNCLLRVMSLNPIYLLRKDEAEKRIDEVALQDGDGLRFGDTLISFEILPDVKENIILEEPVQEKTENQNTETYLCSGEACKHDMSAQANMDGRASELSKVAIYLCEACAEKATHQHYREKKRELGGYSILELLGTGRLGQVFKVRQILTGRVAALKQMLPVAKGDESQLRCFHREINLMMNLEHPNLVRLFEAGQDGNLPFIVSEFVPGGDFSQFIRNDGRPILSNTQAVQCIADTLFGLAFLHTASIVHCYLTPENLLIRWENGKIIPKVTDYSLSIGYKVYGSSTTTTRTGDITSTLMYMPPEQITGFKYHKPPIDIYAMGVILYYLLTGFSPLPGFPAPWQIKHQPNRVHLEKDPIKIILCDERIPLSCAGLNIPDRLCQVVDKAITMKANERYQTADEFRQALLSVLTPADIEQDIENKDIKVKEGIVYKNAHFDQFLDNETTVNQTIRQINISGKENRFSIIDSIEVREASSKGVIQFCVGDLTNADSNDAVDVLVTSAFRNDYFPMPGSLIGALFDKGISVEALAKDKEVDLRQAFSCWLSHEILDPPPGIQFKRILCFEPAGSAEAAELVGDIFRSLAPFLGEHFPVRSVATPLVASGLSHRITAKEALQHLVETSVHWMSSGLPLTCLKIVCLPHENLGELTNLFSELKQRYSNIFSQKQNQFSYDIFISYSHKDTREVDMFVDMLLGQKKDLQIFIDKKALNPGSAWQREIYEAIDDCRKVATFFSPTYLDSKVCLEEFNIALCRHRESEEPILKPIYLYSANLPTYMRLIQYYDCRESNQDKLQQAATYLLQS